MANSKYCVLCGRVKSQDVNRRLYKFPSDPVLCSLWVKAVGRVDLASLSVLKLHTNKQLCQIHFEKEQISGMRLKKSTLPTLHMPEPLPDEVMQLYPIKKISIPVTSKYILLTDNNRQSDHISKTKVFNEKMSQYHEENKVDELDNCTSEPEMDVDINSHLEMKSLDPLDSTSTKKTRSPRRGMNFTFKEMAKLRVLIRNYPVVSSKETDSKTNRRKHQAWIRLAQQFNSDNPCYRSPKQLAKKFSNLKTAKPLLLPATKLNWREDIFTNINNQKNMSVEDELSVLHNMSELLDPSVQVKNDCDLEATDICQPVLQDSDTDIVDPSTIPSILTNAEDEIEAPNITQRRISSEAGESRETIDSPIEEEPYIENYREKKKKKKQFSEEERQQKLKHKDALHIIELELRTKAKHLILTKLSLEVEVEKQKLKNLQIEEVLLLKKIDK